MKPGSGAHHTLLREVQPSSSRANFSIQDLETVFREEGSPSKDFVYDAEHGLYRFPDGEFAFSREYANDLGNESGYGPPALPIGRVPVRWVKAFSTHPRPDSYMIRSKRCSPVTFHELRHIFATFHLASGEKPKVI